MYPGQVVFALTKRDVLMPATFVSYTLTGLMEIASKSGKVYVFNPNNVYDEQTGTYMLYYRRAQDMAAKGYRIAVRNDATFRVYEPFRHGTKGGYIVTVDENLQTCTCLAHQKNAICKHVMAVCSLLWRRAAEAREQGWKPGASRYSHLATELSKAS